MNKENCPKCSAPDNCYYGDTHPYRPPANTCLICGYRKELPMYSKQVEIKAVMATNSKSFRNCAGGCGTRISIATKSDLCKQCRQKLKAKLTIEAAQRQLKELEAV